MQAEGVIPEMGSGVMVSESMTNVRRSVLDEADAKKVRNRCDDLELALVGGRCEGRREVKKSTDVVEKSRSLKRSHAG
jgi:hypothetical protein